MTNSAIVERGWPNSIYAWYVVGVLHVAALFSYVDRLALSLLIDPIRKDLQLSDTQISLVTGAAFAVFYGFMALPIGRLADRHHRPRIIAIGIFAWSLLTATCGLARSFWQLFVFRMGVGIGEASLGATAYTLLSDYFRPSKLPLAVSIYVAAALLGSGLALMAGGWVIQTIIAAPVMDWPIVGELKPWQATFMVVGLPGIFMSALVLTIREPERRGRLYDAAANRPAARALPLRDVVAFVRQHRRIFLPHNLGFAVGGIYAYAVFVWGPTFFIRSFEWTPGRAGVRFGAIVLAFGVTGTYFGGQLASYWMARGRMDALFRVAILSMLLLAPCAALAPLATVPGVALGGFGVIVFLFSMAAAVAPTALQLVTPNEMRGQVSSLFSFASIVIGLGAGPTLVALLTDHVFGFDAALRYSLAIVGCVAALACAGILNTGRGPFREAVILNRQARSLS